MRFSFYINYRALKNKCRKGGPFDHPNRIKIFQRLTMQEDRKKKKQPCCSLLCNRAAQLVKERQFSRHEDWRFTIKGSKNHDIGSKIGSIPLPNSNLFEIHGSIFKPHPSRNPGQTSVVRITHGVLFFCIGKNTLYGLFSHGIEFLAPFGFSQLFDQIEIFLPDMCCEHPLPTFICATNSSAGTVFADFGRTAVSQFPFFACGRMPQFMSSGTGKTVCCCKVSKIPRLKLIFFPLYRV